MGKKMVLLVSCLVVALLLCSAPQVVSAFDHPEGNDPELIVDEDAVDPELDEEDELAEGDALDQDEELEEDGGDYEEEGSDQQY